MPRPKVRPEDRQRAAKACLPCKASKKRCDAQLPCAHCVRRNNAAACTYESSIYAQRSPRRRTSLRPQPRSLTPDQFTAAIVQPNPSAPTPQYDIPDGSRGPSGLLESSSFSPRLTRDRLLLSSKGEQGKFIHLLACETYRLILLQCTLGRQPLFRSCNFCVTL